MLTNWNSLGKWDRYYLKIAAAVAEGSKDPSRQIGAVLVDKENVIRGTGFNGFPPGIADDERLNDREKKYPLIVHAEANALYFAGRESCKGGTLYVYGLPPCQACALQIIRHGVKRVISEYDPNGSKSTRDLWIASANATTGWYEEAGVEFCFVC